MMKVMSKKPNKPNNYDFLGSQDINLLTEEQRDMLDFFIKNPDGASVRLLVRNDKPCRLAVHQRLILKGLWTHQFNLLILTRGGGKTFLLALYVVLKAMLYPREKCVIASSSYRQSQFTFDEVIKFYEESPLLRQATEKAPTKGPNSCEFHLDNGSKIIAYPLGDGQKIRGARANTLVIDEVAQVPEDIISLVIFPMMNTRQDPFDTSGRKNHLVMASSAYFQFNHLYKKYLTYQEKTDKKSPEYNPSYGLHLYNVDDMPDGWMDKEVVAMTRESMTELQYQMEYMCFKGDALVTSENGYKRIDELQAGEKVLTHTSDWNKIIGVSTKEYDGDFIEISSFGSYKKIDCTSEHPIYIKRNGDYIWEHAKNVIVGDYLVRPISTKKTGLKEIRINDYLDIDHLFMFHNGAKYVYPTPSMFKGNPKEEQRTGKVLIKSAVIDAVEINKPFMRLAGYYVAEGSSSSNNQRSLSFSFNKTERDYIDQVKSDLLEVFGVEAKESTVNNCTAVYVNSRVLANFFGNFLGKGHFNKHINKLLLEQDNELLKELVFSAINGDGCLNISREGRKPYVSYYYTSSKLVDDISMALGRLGIMSSVQKRNHSIGGNIDGRDINENKNGGYICAVYGESARKIFDLFDMECEEVNGKFSSRRMLMGEGHVLCRVKIVSCYKYTGSVYNFEVENDNSYCVNDFAVHNCLFPADSDGFYSANLINGAKKASVIIEPEGEKGAQYVFGIDPARTGDNFALVVIRLGPPNKVVACYSLSRNTFPEMHEFIRNKLRIYEMNGGEVVRIHMDNGGGGLTLKDYLAEEYAWYDPETEKFKSFPAIIDIDDEEQQYMSGRRILKMQVFSSQSVNSMNYDLRADIEKRKILLPSMPPKHEPIYEEIFDEIKSMIEETMTIVTTPLSNGFHRFDTPKQRMKKDRYSAFLLACQGARELQKDITGPPIPKLARGFASTSYLNKVG
jgi:intein/homing endonuclease